MQIYKRYTFLSNKAEKQALGGRTPRDVTILHDYYAECPSIFPLVTLLKHITLSPEHQYDPDAAMAMLQDEELFDAKQINDVLGALKSSH